MKKFAFIFVGIIALFGLTSCENCTCNHKDCNCGTTPDCKFHKVTLDLVVNQNQWVFDNNMFYCHFDVPELTANVYNYGEVSINREYNSGTQNAYQVALPETSFYAEDEKDAQGKVINTIYYTQHVDYTYGIGFVEIFFTISDFFYPSTFTPDAMHFRMQMSY